MTFKHKDKGIIRLGDTTDHGGKVFSAHSPLDMGKQIACVGDMTVCPKCKGTFPIVEGDADCTIEGLAHHICLKRTLLMGAQN